MAARGTFFWDYGNAFLLEARARARRRGSTRPDGSFRYPSYVEDIMGPFCFDYGFGPFRWVCASGRPEDLALTDAIAAEVLSHQAQHAAGRQPPAGRSTTCLDPAGGGEPAGRGLAGPHPLRRPCRAASRSRWPSTPRSPSGRLSGPVVLGRDHHDVSGTDSP